jgi:hypothetical protein
MKKLLLWLLFTVMSGTSLAYGSSVTVQFIGPGTSVPYHGVYAGYYNATVNGVPTIVMCDDFTTEIHNGESWLANEFTYADVTGGASTKFSSTAKYSEAGWLYSQTASATPSNRAQIQGAIWNVMTPGSVVMDSLAQWYYNQAIDGSHDNFNWSNVMVVLTPNPFMAGQEFLTPTPVPLPASICLFGSGVLGLIGFSCHKYRNPLHC